MEHPALTVAETVIVPDALCASAALLMLEATPIAASILSVLFMGFSFTKVSPAQHWTVPVGLIFMVGRQADRRTIR